MISTRAALSKNAWPPLRRVAHAQRRCVSDKAHLLQALRRLDTAAICDADKIMLSQDASYGGVRRMDSNMRPVNSQSAKHVMVGFAKTVQCTQRNDFLAVLRGLMEAKKDDVLLVDTCNSDRAVAGELFCLQAIQKGVSGIILDGPVRDTVFVQELSPIRVYATSITPYAGATQSPGNIGAPIACGGLRVDQGEIVVGDIDGIVVAYAETFEALLPKAQEIYELEANIKERLLKGENLASLTNYEEHLAARFDKKLSSLEFKV